jgi:hypothetical protein
MRPCISIYRDVKNGRYVVQPYTEGPVATTAFGEPTVVAPDDFSLRITDAVLANLEKFGKEKYDRSRAIRRSPTEQKQFLREYLEVSVERLESGGLTIYPLKLDGGGRVGYDGDAIVLSERDVSQKLADAIADSFRKAT